MGFEVAEVESGEAGVASAGSDDFVKVRDAAVLRFRHQSRSQGNVSLVLPERQGFMGRFEESFLAKVPWLLPVVLFLMAVPVSVVYLAGASAEVVAVVEIGMVLGAALPFISGLWLSMVAGEMERNRGMIMVPAGVADAYNRFVSVVSGLESEVETVPAGVLAEARVMGETVEKITRLVGEHVKAGTVHTGNCQALVEGLYRLGGEADAYELTRATDVSEADVVAQEVLVDVESFGFGKYVAADDVSGSFADVHEG